ncbi:MULTISPECIES: hypothetical protein [Bosea]|uniref:Uncharacterized protein n=3 Tax=Bosea TaxID=85413 RepID=A0A927I1H0_9HYPH|nr:MULTISPECIES: hypothetical protein [Bosea]MBD3847377.1 hypothetical protein [Bosea spartocytisi]MCP4549363.1 hypothetical protein [bacterium]MCT4475285.1 hypothetical protein [Bosea spartocytisi]PZR80843.1 MAG: hypothetical protein DI537_39000 [Stutzerimonas stutzeri]
MFMTIEDETSVAKIRGYVQAEGEVVHVIARHLFDLSAKFASVGSRGSAFPQPHGRGDESHHGSPTADPRGMPKARNVVDPYGHIHEIRVRTRDFR